MRDVVDGFVRIVTCYFPQSGSFPLQNPHLVGLTEEGEEPDLGDAGEYSCQPEQPAPTDRLGYVASDYRAQDWPDQWSYALNSHGIASSLGHEKVSNNAGIENDGPHGDAVQKSKCNKHVHISTDGPSD